ncbi:type II secretion system protein [Clostridium pasteurianum]|uniref:Prepilin-type N-terminal cleavage/methylation domain-containing protein n=1 Tax=Clostridium pasteurianum BC1 TaxID=86416 RepID=R4KF19_CLOPA|nr:type II secretion system protein [Clostridium pasteurianum]AGK98205.1 prepilin-type N-terminal cleavage/methylation domain-containing protein [Clostridium pasteurianum BC1]
MKKGFTLVEVVASIAIFSITILAISMAFSTSLNISQMNDIKQDTSQYAKAITENYIALRYSAININANTEVSAFKYFNTVDDIQNLFNTGNSMTNISGSVNNTAYPSMQGMKFGVLIDISKTTNLNVDFYHIYVRVWRLDKGAQSQSVRDIYESSD